MVLNGCVNYAGIRSNKRIAAPARFQTGKSLPRQNGHWPDSNWAAQFGDPQLPALIQEALANNPNLQVAQAHVAQSRALVAGRTAALNPNVSWQGTFTEERLSGNSYFPPPYGGSWFTQGELLFRAGYELDFWGKNMSSLRQAISEDNASQAANQQARLSIATSVASTYNQLAYYYALCDVLKRTIRQREALDKISEVRVRIGLDSEVQLYQSRNTTATARTQLVQAEGRIVLTRQQLGTLLGGGPDRGLTIKRPRLPTVSTPALPPNLPLNLLGRRPDIVGARWQVEASCQGVANVKAQFYPNVNLMAAGGVLAFGLSNLFEIASTEFQAGPAISLPIFDAGALRARLRGQYANYEEAVANYNVTLNNALSELANTVTNIRFIDKQLRTQKEALYTAERAYNLARVQYRSGLTAQLVVLQAETRYLIEQRTRLQLSANRRDLQIALIKALGGGFGERAPTQKDSK